MRMLQLTLICCSAMLLTIGCASEKQMEQAVETAQPAATATDTAAGMSEAAPAAHEQITLNVDGMT